MLKKPGRDEASREEKRKTLMKGRGGGGGGGDSIPIGKRLPRYTLHPGPFLYIGGMEA